MPRIATSLLKKAYTLDRLLPPLLRTTRDLQAAVNELRWLREHVESDPKKAISNELRARSKYLKRSSKEAVSNGLRILHEQLKRNPKKAISRQVVRLVRERAKGTPLQYLLGSEYFGDLELACRPGVLIPRQDTANTISHLAQLVRNPNNKLPPELRVLDLCTGSGCIPLLFGHELRKTRRDITYRMLGVDVSTKALALASDNLAAVQSAPGVSNLFSSPKNANSEAEQGEERQEEGKEGKVIANFLSANVLLSPFVAQSDEYYSTPPLFTALNRAGHPRLWDIVISNPPYISPAAYWKTTTRSVRGFEPTLALVPPPQSSAEPWSSLPWIPPPSAVQLFPRTRDGPPTQQGENGDTFYTPLLSIAALVEAKIVLLEIADAEQAVRVARLGKNMNFDGVEIWREQPDVRDGAPSSTSNSTTPEHGGNGDEEQAEGNQEERSEDTIDGIPIVGAGNARCVVFWRGVGATWLGKE
ncbi:hypothetical protein DM02DRAFT_669457 [Periconia macrospinosa]|uniref:S-adenosyl-L-methionine-dependent methyltransferase n=1 Tax=Periconia macrospinosa TaxID=97972 RepID=A0A2V1E023_9PLEO|nr:hypothetical protein DM02DRAFT_669457 [Periconia macrospinosa]